MTKIEWTTRPGGPKGQTWNPFLGCSKIAPECVHCYAPRSVQRNMHEAHSGVAIKGEWTGVIKRNTESVWKAPYSWPAGTLCFTCSLSDFWHESVPLEWLDEALAVIEATPKVTYQILTKRPGNIARKLADLKRRFPANAWAGVTIGHPQSLPLLKPLRAIEAKVRFLSVEPLLAPMVPGLELDGIHWVIAGGESGPAARPCDPEWVRGVRDLCVARGVPFFFKQWGKIGNNLLARSSINWRQELDPDAKGGATLDGRLWREFPDDGSERKMGERKPRKVMDNPSNPLRERTAHNANIVAAFEVSLSSATEAYQEVSIQNSRSDIAVLNFVARCGLTTREARALDMSDYEVAAKKAGVKLNAKSKARREIGVIKAAARDPDLNQPHWYNCASYVAQPKSLAEGEEPPPAPESVEAAVELIESKGGLRACSNLEKAWRDLQNFKPSDDTPLLQRVDALLDGHKHAMTVLVEKGIELPAGYCLALVRMAKKGGTAYVIAGSDDATILRTAGRIRKQGAFDKPNKGADQVRAVVSKIKAAKAKREAEAPAAKPELQQGECPVCRTVQTLNRSGTFGSHRRAKADGKGTFACDGKGQAPVAGTVTPVSEAAEAAE